jgi:hypothetical protein
MPGIWAELECAEQQLSNDFRRAVAVHRQKFAELGFSEQGFKKLRRILNPNSRDRGGLNYLDSSRRHYCQLIYSKTYIPSLDSEKEALTIAFTAVFESQALSCTNGPQTPLNSLPNHKIARIKSNDAAAVYRHFLELLNQRGDRPRHFPDLSSLRAWFDSNALQIFEHNVRRGLLVRMSDYEVEVAQRKLPPELKEN